MSFKNLKLGTKQKVGFGLVLILLTGANLFSLYNMDRIKHGIDEISKNWLPRAIAIADINLNTSELRRLQLQHAFATDERDKQEQANLMINLIDKIQENLNTYDSLKTISEIRNLYSAEEAELYMDFDEKWDEYQELSFTFFMLSRENQSQEAIELLNGHAKDVYNEFSTALVKLVEVNKTESFLAAQKAEQRFRTAFVITIILLILTFFTSIAIATVVMAKYIRTPVLQLEQAAREVAKGDLKIQLDISSEDEIGSLANSFNQMTVALAKAKAKMEKQAYTLQAQNRQLENAMRELREAQEQLLLKEKMASLGDLVAGVAHEINNPIGAVNASADVISRCVNKLAGTLNGSKEEAKTLNILKSSIQVISNAGQRIATIVKSLKTFAHLDESEYQKVDLHDGIESSLTLLGPELEDRVSVVKDFHDIPKIVCFPSQLNQVFLNLLKNASKAIRERGQIDIRTFRDNGHIHVEISDNGEGIPREKLHRIFDFGFSSDDARIKMSSGLSSAYSIVQKHQGQIKVESELGKGTTFSIILPIKGIKN